jgi:K(+)-stimulated pyrophosphate-energized sodium pump
LVASYALGAAAGKTLGTSPGISGIYGTAVATMGMLMTAAYILAMDTFGPIADNAGGIVEMSHAPTEVRKGTDALDAAGNTTKALTKGYAIGSAALAAFLLFSAFLDKVELVVRTRAEVNGLPLNEIELLADAVHVVDLSKVPVFIGALAGGVLVFLFSALAIRAVGKAGEKMIAEVRRQFKADPGILAGTSKPDYARAVDISTAAALQAMIAPGLLAIGLPVLVGVILRFEATAGLLMVGTLVGILLALMMNNSGAAWDNAKKLIEAGKFGGKGSEAHAAAVVGDTVGDPFKDTAGPSLHVLIKLLATVTLVLAPLFI